MKKLTCKDLGGPCDHEIIGETLEDIGQQCQSHVMEQVNKGDKAHITAVEAWKSQSAEDQQARFAEFQRKFEDAPEA